MCNFSAPIPLTTNFIDISNFNLSGLFYKSHFVVAIVCYLFVVVAVFVVVLLNKFLQPLMKNSINI